MYWLLIFSDEFFDVFFDDHYLTLYKTSVFHTQIGVENDLELAVVGRAHILWKNENATSKMISAHCGISGLTICRQTFDANTSVSVKSQNSFCRCWLNGQIIAEKIVESTWFVTETPRVIQRWQKRSDFHVQSLPGNLFNCSKFRPKIRSKNWQKRSDFHVQLLLGK